MTEERPTKPGDVSSATSREESTTTSHIERSPSSANKDKPTEVTQEWALTRIQEQSCYNFEGRVVPKEETTTLQSPLSQPKRRPQCKSRSPKSNATTQEEDSTATREKPPATIEEDTPDSIPRRSNSAAKIDEPHHQKRKEAPEHCNERKITADIATKEPLTKTRKEPAKHNYRAAHQYTRTRNG